jgi:16S rRNA (adenine(1408)-N(1))-methyltransferase
LVGRYARTIVDLGTGDGAAVLRTARENPSALVIGVDTDASSLREPSWRAARPISKGGVPNALFLVADASVALTALRGRVHELRITLPWGSLLRLVLEGERDFAHAVAGSL